MELTEYVFRHAGFRDIDVARASWNVDHIVVPGAHYGIVERARHCFAIVCVPATLARELGSLRQCLRKETEVDQNELEKLISHL